MKFKQGQQIKTKQIITGSWKHGGSMPNNTCGVIKSYDYTDDSYLVVLEHDKSTYWFAENEISSLDELEYSLNTNTLKQKSKINFKY